MVGISTSQVFSSSFFLSSFLQGGGNKLKKLFGKEKEKEVSSGMQCLSNFDSLCL